MRVKPTTSALNCVSRAIERAIAYRSVNALITETFDLAKQQYENALEAQIETFPVVVKDCFAVEGVRMTCASQMMENYIAPYSATCVQRLIKRGGCLIGKGNMDEFAMGSTSMHSHFGPVKHFSHAFDHQTIINESEDESTASGSDWRLAGGSSGGCAVAVALGMARVALGSDTGGSTRNPAAFNGVFGFKPSYGTLSRHGLVPLANSFDVPAIFANSVADCRHFYDMMRGVDEMDSTSIETKSLDAIQNRRNSEFVIGLPKEYRNELLSRDAEEAWNNAAEHFKSMGFIVKEVCLPLTDYSIVCYHILAESDIASNMARYDGVRFGYRNENEEDVRSFDEMLTRSRTVALNYSVKRRIIAGNFFNVKENLGKYYHQAAKVRRLIKNDFDAAFRQVDALLTPTTSHTAPLFSEVRRLKFRERQRRDDYFTQPANMAGLPAISVPVSKCASNGLPIGVQIVCDHLHDSRCLDLAEKLESSLCK